MAVRSINEASQTAGDHVELDVQSVLDGGLFALKIIIIIVALSLIVCGFLHRNMPQVGGKIGPIRRIDHPRPPPSGFSRVYARAMTLFVASDAASFATEKTFLRGAPVQKPVVMRIYRVAGCKTEIEIPDQSADYERIDAEDALRLLRELPDTRIVRRLHISDERSFFDPWLRKVRGENVSALAHATNFSLIVLYRPDRRSREALGITVLHEWLHLVAFASTVALWRFKRANVIETLPSLAVEPLKPGDRNSSIHEAWCDLGERLLGYDESMARQTALASPVHAIILWRCIERMLRRTPPKLRSTRFDELLQRGEFMRSAVERKARMVRVKERRHGRL